MLNHEKQTPTLTAGADLKVLTSDEYQEEMANRISEEVFQTEDNAEKVVGVIGSFLQSYEQHKNEQSLEEWLCAEFKKYPDIWKDEEEIRSSARDVISSIEISNRNKKSLHDHLKQGKSEASWLAKEMEKGAAATGAVNVGAYADCIDSALGQANQKNWAAILRKDGFVSQNPHLHGFIAEHHYANSFNIDAVAKGSPYRAKVLEPMPGETYGKNSMDIGVYDGNGKLVQRYQLKCGADAEATATLFEKGDYRGQRKLVPKGQAKDIKGSTEVVEIDGVSCTPRSMEELKELQKKAQQEQEAKQYEWNDVNKITVAKQIGKQALVGACITAGMHGTRILARRVWNSLNGKTNPDVNEDLKEFFESTIESAAHVGVQVAVSGAFVVAGKNGWLGQLLKNSPAGRIANIAYVGLENAKVLFKLNNGDLNKDEALDAMGRTTTTAIVTIAGAVEGAALGASYGVVFGPAGVAVGSFVGGVAGSIAGSSIGEAVYEGGKAIVKTALHTAKVVVSGIVGGAKSVGEGIRNVASSISSFFSLS